MSDRADQIEILVVVNDRETGALRDRSDQQVWDAHCAMLAVSRQEQGSPLLTITTSRARAVRVTSAGSPMRLHRWTPPARVTVVDVDDDDTIS